MANTKKIIVKKIKSGIPTKLQVKELLSAGGDLSYNSTTGQFSVTTYKDSDALALINATVDSDFINNLIGQIDSAAVVDIIQGNVDRNYMYPFLKNDFLDSAEVLALIDSDYINFRVSTTDSNQVISIINETVDSDYINSKIDIPTAVSGQFDYGLITDATSTITDYGSIA